MLNSPSFAPQWTRFLLLALAVFTISTASGIADDKIEHFRLREKSTYPDAVIVKNTALAHTGMIYATNAAGQIPTNEPLVQFMQLVQNTDAVLKAAGSKAENIVKLNFYANSEKNLKFAKKFFAKTLSSGKGGAATNFAVSPLPIKEAIYATDLVFATDHQYEEVVHLKTPVENVRLSILPEGRTVYISGQLEKGKGVVETAKNTMEGLHRTLQHIGLNASNVVSIKTFINPMSKVADVDAVIDSFYEEDKAPPVVHIEWKTTNSIEIEMVVSVPEKLEIEGADATQPVQHFWLPWLSKSPVYCRWTLINSPSRIYIKETMVDFSKDPVDEIHQVFGILKKVLEGTGSDLKHLAKATYYITDARVSPHFGKIRPEYYDPKHPPAASMAKIQAVGRAERELSIDMIAVPTAKPTPEAAAETKSE